MATKTLLAKRAGYLCSFPGCRVPTIGPKIGSDAVMLTGDAAHIAGASPKGPRYDRRQTRATRASIDNAIWLCVLHARAIDSDKRRYPAKMLQKWKIEHERLVAQLQLGLVRLADGAPQIKRHSKRNTSLGDDDLFLLSIPFVRGPREKLSGIRSRVQELGIVSSQSKKQLDAADRKGYLTISRREDFNLSLLWQQRCTRRSQPSIILYAYDDRWVISINLEYGGIGIPDYAEYAVINYIEWLIDGELSGSSGDSVYRICNSADFYIPPMPIEKLEKRLRPVVKWLQQPRVSGARPRR